MTGTMGIRAPLGVNISSSSIVGTSAATTSMPCSSQQVKQKSKVAHGSPKDHPGSNFLHMAAAPNKALWEAQPLKAHRRMVISLSNLPTHMNEDDIQEMLAPWSSAVLGLTCNPEDTATQTFQAEMEYAAAVEAISELDRSSVAGHTLFVQSIEGAESSRSSMDEVHGMDL